MAGADFPKGVGQGLREHARRTLDAQQDDIRTPSGSAGCRGERGRRRTMLGLCGERQLVRERMVSYPRASVWRKDPTADGHAEQRGRLVKDRASGKPKMSCRNWECGVVVPAPGLESGVARKPAAAAGEIVADISVFGRKVPVPMKMPGPQYGPKEEPWYFLNA